MLRLTYVILFALIANIGFLAYFKYMNFFIANANDLFGTDIGLLHLALPLAISFFTLQQIAFLVDSYQGLIKEKSLLIRLMWYSKLSSAILFPVNSFTLYPLSVPTFPK